MYLKVLLRSLDVEKILDLLGDNFLNAYSDMSKKTGDISLQHFEKCIEELEIAKSTKIKGLPFSFYSLIRRENSKTTFKCRPIE